MLYPDSHTRLQFAREHQAELAREFGATPAMPAAPVSARSRGVRRRSLIAHIVRRRHAPRPAIGAS
jgi:hypothetical protein